MGQRQGETLERRRTQGAEQGQAGEVEAQGERSNRPRRAVYLSVRVERGGQAETARIIAGFLVSTSAAAVDFNIHEPGKDGDERNHHCHMMFTTRRMTAKGLGEKTREWDDLRAFESFGPVLSENSLPTR
jgi:hypothetical protein